MNTRSHNLCLNVSANQVDEVAKGISAIARAVFHTILLHRTTGKYSYSKHQNGTFSVGTLGTEDVDCNTFEFTYVRCASVELDQWLIHQIQGFSASLCHQQGSLHSGKLKLEFYERKKGRWLLPAETSNWEVWTLQLDLIHPQSEEEWERHRQKLSAMMGETVLFIAEVVNTPDYIPRNPAEEALPSVFDMQFPTVQPYLHRVSPSDPYLHRVTFELGGESVAGSVRKFIRDTFAYNY